MPALTKAMTNHSSYLPHIDGLRAIALAGVLLFHFQVPYFRGGFAGVDIFLTISGYLITRQILSHHSKSSSFSLSEFYTRRFFRLYPAATVTVLLSVLAAIAIFQDDLTKEAARSGLAAMLVSANVFFHLISGYFDSSVIVKPLLHMWSLSLEEQFYLLWAPLIAVHFMAFSSVTVVFRIQVTLIILTVVSIFSGVYFAYYYPSFAFFHLPSRIFQFSIGALLAAFQRNSLEENEDGAVKTVENGGSEDFSEQKSCSSLSLLATFFAVFVIIFTYVVLPENSPPLAMLPVNSATLILLALPDSPVCKYVLSSTISIFLGRLSYSAYLIHWPLYVFARFVMLAFGMDKPHPVIMIVVTILMALVLKNCVEDPVRTGKRLARVMFAAFAAFTLLFCIKMSVVEVKGTSQMNFQIERDASLALFGNSNPSETRKLVSPREEPIVSLGQKVISKITFTGDLNSTTQPAMTLIGNSFAAHLIPAFYLIGKRRKVWFQILSGNGCSVMAPSVYPRMRNNIKNCRKFNQVAWDAILKLSPNSTVGLAMLWNLLTVESFVARVKPIANDLAKRNLRLVLLGEPPGMSDKYESYNDCLDMLEKPIGKVLSMKRNGFLCGFNPQEGGAPIKERLAAYDVYNKVFPNEISGIKFIDVMQTVCNITQNEKKESVGANCKLPIDSLLTQFPSLPGTGYQRDLKHLSILGSGGLSVMYESLLADYL